MDGTRSRRTRDAARQRWYAIWRRRRFARFLGFVQETAGREREARSDAGQGPVLQAV